MHMHSDITSLLHENLSVSQSVCLSTSLHFTSHELLGEHHNGRDEHPKEAPTLKRLRHHLGAITTIFTRMELRSSKLIREHHKVPRSGGEEDLEGDDEGIVEQAQRLGEVDVSEEDGEAHQQPHDGREEQCSRGADQT